MEKAHPINKGGPRKEPRMSYTEAGGMGMGPIGINAAAGGIGMGPIGIALAVQAETTSSARITTFMTFNLPERI